MDPILKSHKRKRPQLESDIERLDLSRGKRNADHKHGDRLVNDENEINSRAIPKATCSSTKSATTPFEKVSNLLRALSDVLEESGAGDTLDLIGDEARGKCIDLQASLQRRPKIDLLAHDKSKVGTALSAYVTPWKAAEIPNSFPPLPPILDKTLEEATFSHPSVSVGKFKFMNYEHLEWVGDAYIEMLTTLLISQTFQRLTPGKMTILRERLIRNSQLEKYSLHYGFDKRLNFGGDPFTREAKVKIMGDVFEAYAAAVVLSDPVNGFSRLTGWLKDLWGVTLKKEIASEEKLEETHLNPMWNLVGSSKEALVISVAPPNFKDQLRQALGGKGIKVDYRDTAPPSKDRHTGLPLYNIGVFLDGWGAKGLHLGHGSALSKKDAGMKAAEMAMKNKKLLAPYVEKKRLFDAQVALERQALEDALGPGSVSS